MDKPSSPIHCTRQQRRDWKRKAREMGIHPADIHCTHDIHIEPGPPWAPRVICYHHRRHHHLDHNMNED